MKTAEYRDLISALSDAFASCKSAATDTELDDECEHLERHLKALTDAEAPQRLSRKDAMKSLALRTRVRQHLFSTRMYLHDNQRIEAEYLGTPW